MTLLDTGAERATGRQADRRVRLYDFTQSELFDRNDLRTVRLLLESVAKRFGRLLSSRLRAAVRVESGEIDQRSWTDISSTLEDPAHLTAFSMHPLPGRAMLHLPQKLSMHLVDLALGGIGQGPFPNRALSEVEQAVVGRLCQDILQELVSSLPPSQQVSLAVIADVSSPVLLQVPAPQATYLLGEMTMELPGADPYTASLCLPLLMLRPAMPALAGVSEEAGSNGEQIQEVLAERLLDIDIEAAIRFPSVTLSSSRITALSPGDVIPLRLDCELPLELAVGGLVRARVMPGKRGRKLSCTILEVSEESQR